MPASSLVLRWVPCFSASSSSSSYLPLCDTSFGFDPSLRSVRQEVDPNDLTCFSDLIGQRVFEYRYHVEALGRLEVACPMSVDYMRSNTCYKMTAEMTWREARRQCWRWGGELAFPLASGSDECATRIYSSSTEEARTKK